MTRSHAEYLESCKVEFGRFRRRPNFVFDGTLELFRKVIHFAKARLSVLPKSHYFFVAVPHRFLMYHPFAIQRLVGRLEHFFDFVQLCLQSRQFLVSTYNPITLRLVVSGVPFVFDDESLHSF